MGTVDPSTLAEDYAGFVSYIAREIHRELNQRGGQCGDFEEKELVQEGWLGLLAAVRRFDPERGIKFSTFAAYRISRSYSRLSQQSPYDPIAQGTSTAASRNRPGSATAGAIGPRGHR